MIDQDFLGRALNLWRPRMLIDQTPGCFGSFYEHGPSRIIYMPIWHGYWCGAFSTWSLRWQPTDLLHTSMCRLHNNHFVGVVSCCFSSENGEKLTNSIFRIRFSNTHTHTHTHTHTQSVLIGGWLRGSFSSQTFENCFKFL